MPLPLLAWLAIAAAAGGVGAGVKGGVDMSNAKDLVDKAKKRNERNQNRLESTQRTCISQTDKLGKYELEIVKSFDEFSRLFEKIHNKPSFETINSNNYKLPRVDFSELKETSVTAAIVLGGLGGAALGTASGFAAAGATTSIVMAIGTASTGTAISALSGAAATNATLAALGGGSLAAGGGGMAAGAAALSGATLGFGLLVGGFVFAAVGSNMKGKAEEAWDQMLENENEINKACIYLDDLKRYATKYYDALYKVNRLYQTYLSGLKTLVDLLGKTNWNSYSSEEKKLVENTVLLVGLLYNMCKVGITKKAANNNDNNPICKTEIDNSINNANEVLKTGGIDLGLSSNQSNDGVVTSYVMQTITKDIIYNRYKGIGVQKVIVKQVFKDAVLIEKCYYGYSKLERLECYDKEDTVYLYKDQVIEIN